jgi:DNA-binding phage protein
MHNGEFEVGRRMLRNYINATMGFGELSERVGSPPKSLMRMLSERSNPHADRLLGIIRHLQSRDRFKVRVVPEAIPRRRARRPARTHAA